MKLFNNYSRCPHAFIKKDGKKLTKAQRVVGERFGNPEQKWAGRYYCRLSETLCPGECNNVV